ncbi:MAG: non-ribosomal peptide synthetase, partial [Xanthobacteraceae bacterium]
YGLTETSDDTNHEVMDKAPEGNLVPLGPCVRNAYVYVVDENLSPVPLGAPGEIVFSGVCVGRGYVNDPERTAKSFIADPLREGERLYRSGDFGRWHPDGKLEFLGRQDAQVKIRGFRIEIGDIENALLRVDGVATGAVVIAERDNASKQLVAFYSGADRTSADVVQSTLADVLPEYMVPSVFHWQETLPLTANGKIDKKLLRKLALELDDRSGDFEAPVSPSEQKVAAAWAKVLSANVDTVSRLDHFFDSGGTSLTAVKLVVGLERKVTLQEVMKHPVLADLAELLNAKTGVSVAARPAA